jgi:autotransporter-associated beta strand protein
MRKSSTCCASSTLTKVPSYAITISQEIGLSLEEVELRLATAASYSGYVTVEQGALVLTPNGQNALRDFSK